MESEQLRLSRFQQSDAPSLLEYPSSPNVAKTVTWEAHRDLEESFGYFLFQSKCLQATANRTMFVVAMREKSSGKAICSVGLIRDGIAARIGRCVDVHKYALTRSDFLARACAFAAKE